MRKFSKCLLASLLALIPAAAAAQTLGFDFSVPAVVSNSQTEVPLAWYTDRYAPTDFTAAGGVLSETVTPAGFQTPTPSFYNTQGNKFDLLAGTTSVSIQLYVPKAWETSNERLAGFWTTGFDSTYTSTNGDYPIIEFQGPITSCIPGPSCYLNGGVAGFYGWNNMTNSFTYLGLPGGSGFKYNAYYKLTVALTGGQIVYTVSDTNGNNPVSQTSPESDPLGDLFLGNVILEGYNYDNTSTIQWRKLTYTFDSNGQIVWN